MPSQDAVISSTQEMRGESPVKEHGENTVLVYGRIELIPNMGVNLFSPEMVYYRQGIYDSVADNKWDNNMGGSIDTNPVYLSAEYYYLQGHRFGQACVRRRFTNSPEWHNLELSAENVDIVVEVV
jgi:hypothetical protein